MYQLRKNASCQPNEGHQGFHQRAHAVKQDTRPPPQEMRSRSPGPVAVENDDRERERDDGGNDGNEVYRMSHGAAPVAR